MSDITFSLGDVAWIVGFILSIGGLIALYQKANQPYRDLERTVERHTDDLMHHTERFEKGNKRFDATEETLRVLVRSQLALIDHAITSNGIDNMKKVRKELENFLIENH